MSLPSLGRWGYRVWGGGGLYPGGLRRGFHSPHRQHLCRALRHSLGTDEGQTLHAADQDTQAPLQDRMSVLPKPSSAPPSPTGSSQTFCGQEKGKHTHPQQSVTSSM